MGKKSKAADCTKILTWKVIICKKRVYYVSTAIQVEYAATRNHAEKLFRDLSKKS